MSTIRDIKITDQDANCVVLECAIKSVDRLSFAHEDIHPESQEKLRKAVQRLAARLREQLVFARKQ